VSVLRGDLLAEEFLRIDDATATARGCKACQAHLRVQDKSAARFASDATGALVERPVYCIPSNFALSIQSALAMRSM
jgi:hypothetical protein